MNQIISIIMKQSNQPELPDESEELTKDQVIEIYLNEAALKEGYQDWQECLTKHFELKNL